MPKRINAQSIDGQSLYRTQPLASVRVLDEEKRSLELSFSSETEVDRYFGREVLGHKSDEIRMDWMNSGNAPLLLDHRYEKQIGVIESARLDNDGKTRAMVRFGKSALAEEIYQDVREGIRKNISVGYWIYRMVLEETSDDSEDLYRATDWEPLEISVVAVPADPNIGIGRSWRGRHTPPSIQILSQRKDNPMPQTLPDTAPNPTSQIPDSGLRSTQSAPQSPVDIKVIENQVREAEIKRIDTIRTIADLHKMPDLGLKAINERISVADFQGLVLEELSQRQGDKIRTVDENDALIGLSAKEARDFSLLRAVRAVVHKDNNLAPLEMEVIKATRQKFKDKAFEGNIQIPMDILRMPQRQIDQRQASQRDLTVGGATAGAELVGTTHLAGSFIDALRGRLLIAQLGAKFLTGLVGNLSIPKLVGGASAYWVVESGDITESTQTTGAVNLIPKTVGAYTDISRKLLLQSSPDAEMMVRDDLMKVVARAIDSAAFGGSGVSGQPTGIVNVTGIGAVDYGAGITFGDMVDLESEISQDNALLGSLAYVTTPTLAGTMKQTLKESGVAGYIWENNQVNGHPAFHSTLSVAGEVLFGNWEDLIVGNWGVMDIKVDEASLAKSGGIRIVALQDIDVAVRHAQSFARAYT